MSKTRKISLLAAIAVILALLVVAFITKGSENTVDCPDCEDGITTCNECDGFGTIKDDDGEYYTCEKCEMTGEMECETCYDSDAKEASTVVRGSLWALLPPLVAIALALITKEV